MLPYFGISEIPIGRVWIQVWGTMVVFGLAAAIIAGRRCAAVFGLDKERFTDMSVWAVIGGTVGARVGYSIMYQWPAVNILGLWRIWEGGMSIVGAVLGALLAVLIWSRLARVDFWRYADLAAFVLPLGCAIGRVGCFLIHDHPGIRSSLFFAVDLPGGPRLDLGLLLAVFDLVLFGVFVLILRRAGAKKPPFLAYFSLIYGVVRFGLDFLRAWDGAMPEKRWFWLTPAQYVMFGFVAFGLWLLLVRSGKKRTS